MSVNIEVGQIWRDKDKRRESRGTVRTFRVEEVSASTVTCRITSGWSGPEGRSNWFHFNRFRFGSGRANDSFELVAENPNPAGPQLCCLKCTPQSEQMRSYGGPYMIVCPECGKRCPKATDHRNACTGSNDPGQPGSVYGGLPSGARD